MRGPRAALPNRTLYPTALETVPITLVGGSWLRVGATSTPLALCVREKADGATKVSATSLR